MREIVTRWKNKNKTKKERYSFANQYKEIWFILDSSSLIILKSTLKNKIINVLRVWESVNGDIIMTFNTKPRGIYILIRDCYKVEKKGGEKKRGRYMYEVQQIN